MPELKIPACWLVYAAQNEDGSLELTLRVDETQAALIQLFINYHADKPKSAVPPVVDRLRNDGYM